MIFPYVIDTISQFKYNI